MNTNLDEFIMSQKLELQEEKNRLSDNSTNISDSDSFVLNPSVEKEIENLGNYSIDTPSVKSSNHEMSEQCVTDQFYSHFPSLTNQIMQKEEQVVQQRHEEYQKYLKQTASKSSAEIKCKQELSDNYQNRLQNKKIINEIANASHAKITPSKTMDTTNEDKSSRYHIDLLENLKHTDLWGSTSDRNIAEDHDAHVAEQVNEKNIEYHRDLIKQMEDEKREVKELLARDKAEEARSANRLKEQLKSIHLEDKLRKEKARIISEQNHIYRKHFSSKLKNDQQLYHDLNVHETKAISEYGKNKLQSRINDNNNHKNIINKYYNNSANYPPGVTQKFDSGRITPHYPNQGVFVDSTNEYDNSQLNNVISTVKKDRENLGNCSKSKNHEMSEQCATDQFYSHFPSFSSEIKRKEELVQQRHEEYQQYLKQTARRSSAEIKCKQELSDNYQKSLQKKKLINEIANASDARITSSKTMDTTNDLNLNFWGSTSDGNFAEDHDAHVAEKNMEYGRDLIKQMEDEKREVKELYARDKAEGARSANRLKEQLKSIHLEDKLRKEKARIISEQNHIYRKHHSSKLETDQKLYNDMNVHESKTISENGKNKLQSRINDNNNHKNIINKYYNNSANYPPGVTQKFVSGRITPHYPNQGVFVDSTDEYDNSQLNNVISTAKKDRENLGNCLLDTQNSKSKNHELSEQCVTDQFYSHFPSLSNGIMRKEELVEQRHEEYQQYRKQTARRSSAEIKCQQELSDNYQNRLQNKKLINEIANASDAKITPSKTMDTTNEDKSSRYHIDVLENLKHTDLWGSTSDRNIAEDHDAQVAEQVNEKNMEYHRDLIKQMEDENREVNELHARDKAEEARSAKRLQKQLKSMHLEDEEEMKKARTEQIRNTNEQNHRLSKLKKNRKLHNHMNVHDRKAISDDNGKNKLQSRINDIDDQRSLTTNSDYNNHKDYKYFSNLANYPSGVAQKFDGSRTYYPHYPKIYQ